MRKRAHVRQLDNGLAHWVKPWSCTLWCNDQRFKAAASHETRTKSPTCLVCLARENPPYDD